MCGHLQRERCSLKVATQFNINAVIASGKIRSRPQRQIKSATGINSRRIAS
jgi:hypothetical protein